MVANISKGLKDRNSGLEKAAILMMSINQDVASKIFSMLEDDVIRDISLTMSSLGTVPSERVEELMLDFGNEMNASASVI